MNHDIDARAIAGHLSAITWAIQTFMVSLCIPFFLAAANMLCEVESMLAIEFALDVIHICASPDLF